MEIVQSYSPYYIQGLLYTIILAISSIIIGLLFALLLTVMRRSHIAPFRWVGNAYVEVIRGTPILVQLMLIYYGICTLIPIPSVIIFGFIDTSMFIPGAIAVACNSAAYVSEIIRAGIQAVDIGQVEAARSLGMSSRMNMQYIVLPQAVKNILPALGNEFVTVIKESSVCMIIGIPELMYNANIAKGATFRVMETIIPAAVIYFVLTFTISKILTVLERRMRHD
ncbi:MAG: amino acid ABC transporter permease [Oscillospiraceae bacterium]|nr:amino acid ABC transporter permease [Oscillospiraceae bacterium]